MQLVGENLADKLGLILNIKDLGKHIFWIDMGEFWNSLPHNGFGETSSMALN